MSLFRDTGVVLRTYRLGEADRIIVVMTESHGKVRAVAKGVRRTSSKFGARLEPLTHVDLLLWQGRSDLDIVNQVEVIDTFRTVREDLHRVAKGLALLEVTDQMARPPCSMPAQRAASPTAPSSWWRSIWWRGARCAAAAGAAAP